MNTRRVFRDNVRWSFAGSMGAAAVQLLQTIVFARFAGAEAAGEYALAATIIAFLTPLAEAGMAQAVVRAKSVQPGQLATLIGVNTTLGVILFALLFGFGPTIGYFFESPDLPDLILLMGSALVFTPLGAPCGALLLRQMRFDQAARIEWAATLAGFIVVSILAAGGWGAWSMAWGFVVKNAIATLGVWYYAQAIMRVEWRKPAPLREVADMLRFGAFDLGARMADAASNYADKLVVGKLLGATTLGYYNLAFSLFMIPTARIGSVATRAAFPIFARLSDDKPKLQSFFERTNRLLLMTLAPIYMGVSLFADELIHFLYGPAWAATAPILSVMAWAGLIRSASAAMPQLSAGVGKPQYQLLFMLAWTAALNLTLFGLLHIRPEGVHSAWARVIAKLVFELPMLWLLARALGVQFKSTLYFLIKTAMITGVIFALSYGVASILQVEFAWILKIPISAFFLFWIYRKAGWWDEIGYYFRKSTLSEA